MVFFKRTYLSALALLSISMTSVHAEPIPPFKDIKGSFAFHAITSLHEKGLINGVSEDEFAPQMPVKRKHFVLLLGKTLGVQPIDPLQPTFVDIPRESTEYGYIEAFAKLGYIQGIDKKSFKGDAPIQRQQAAVILDRIFSRTLMANSQSNDTSYYKDQERIQPYARESVQHISSMSLMRGYHQLFSPQKSLSRAETAVITQQVYDWIHQEQEVRFLEGIQLKVGESQTIPMPFTNEVLPSSPVWGWDNPAIGHLTADGQFTSKAAGKGLISLNLGKKTYQIPIEIIGKEITVNPPPSSSPSVNLAYGTKVTITADVPNATFRDAEYKTYSGPVDGLASNLETWTGFARQDGRQIEVDLGANKIMEQISLQFKQDLGSAITLPPFLRIEVSQDGQNWSALGQMHPSVSSTEAKQIERTFQFVFSPLQARYVRLSFPVDIWVFARNLKIIGDQNQEIEPVILPFNQESQPSSGSFMNLPDNRDILLIYTGAHGEKGTWKKDELKSVIGYMKDGVVKGPMFDTILFLPYAEIESTETAWSEYLEDLFQLNSQLGALNQAAGEMDPPTDFKEKVILSIPFPDTKTSELWREEGKVGLDTIEDQQKAIKWYMAKLMEKWNQAGYQHLELSGIYWWKEKIEMNSTNEEELVKSTASLVHQYSLPFYWIPYYGARGYSTWKELGFDHVLIQPNYYGKQVPTDDRMKDVADLARRFHMGVEVEMDEWVLISRYYYDAFYKQLDQGHEWEIDQNVTNAYYTGSKTLPSIAKSEIPEVRKIYDDLYLWMQGKYK